MDKNKDDITEAVHGLDIFMKNWCMNCVESKNQNDLIFNCNKCEFKMSDEKCLVKCFANSHNHKYPIEKFGAMGDY